MPWTITRAWLQLSVANKNFMCIFEVPSIINRKSACKYIRREQWRQREKYAQVCGMVDYDHGHKWNNQLESERMLAQQRLKSRTRSKKDQLCKHWSDPSKPISSMIWSSLILLFHDHVLGGAPPCSLVVGDSLFNLPWPWKCRHGLF